MNKNNTSFIIILLAVSMAQFLVPFVMTSVGAVLPLIGKDLGSSAHTLAMFNTVYVLGLAIFQLAAGRMGDIWGRRKIFLYGNAIFIISSVSICFVDNMTIILIMRTLQGAGAAMLIATGLAIIAIIVPIAKRARYLGIMGSAVYAGMACGPIAAGFIANFLNWRWIFGFNALFCLIIFILMAFSIKYEWADDIDDAGESFDYKGCSLYALGIIGITFGGSYLNYNLIFGLSLLCASFFTLYLYVKVELKIPFPLLDVRMLVNNKIYGLSSLASFINYCSTFGLIFYFSIYLQLVRGMSVAEAGFFLAIPAVIQVIGAPIASRLVEKYNVAIISSIGIFISACSLFATSFLNATTPYWYLIAVKVVLGLGVSLFAIPNTILMLGSVDRKHLGQAAGLNGAVRTGGAMTSMIIVTISMGLFLGREPLSPQNISAFLTCMQLNMFLFSIINLIAAFFGFLRLSVKKENTIS